MRRIAPVKSQEELQSDIFCLKRQLTVALDEIQLLKVKTRRLKDELRRKDKHVECLMRDSQKDRQFGSMICKLQKRNAELEDMILERDLNEEKRYKDLRTVCIYTQSMDGQQDKKKGCKTPTSNIARFKSRPKNNSPSLNSFGKISASDRAELTKRDRMRSSDSSLQNCPSPRATTDCYSTNTPGDSPNVQSPTGKDTTIPRGHESLGFEKVLEKRLLQKKNAEISRLSAELQQIKQDLLRKQECESLTKSTSTSLDPEGLQSDGSAKIIPVCTNLIEENKRHASRLSRKRYNDGKVSPRTIECSETEDDVEKNKLSTLHEQNEETSLLKTPETSSEEYNHKSSKKSSSSRPKTRIEYVYDSEVSSDGEEFSLSSNLTNFLQRAINTSSSGDAS